VLRVQQEPQVLKEIEVQQVQQEHQVRKVQKDHKVQQVQKDHKVQQVLKVQQDLQQQHVMVFTVSFQIVFVSIGILSNSIKKLLSLTNLQKNIVQILTAKIQLVIGVGIILI
jgi:hypothetical protein